MKQTDSINRNKHNQIDSINRNKQKTDRQLIAIT